MANNTQKWGLYDYDSQTLVTVTNSEKEAKQKAKKAGLVRSFVQPINGIKTLLPSEIKTVEGAKAFLTELHKNGESYHFEDSARDIEGKEGNPIFSIDEANRLDELMEQIYAISREQDFFNPCEFLIELEEATEGTIFYEIKKRREQEKEGSEAIALGVSIPIPTLYDLEQKKLEAAKSIKAIAEIPQSEFLETHFEIVSWINEAAGIEDTLPNREMNHKGQGGLYELAENLTKEFLAKYGNTVWGQELDYYDTLEEFLNEKNK